MKFKVGDIVCTIENGYSVKGAYGESVYYCGCISKITEIVYGDRIYNKWKYFDQNGKRIDKKNADKEKNIYYTIINFRNVIRNLIVTDGVIRHATDREKFLYLTYGPAEMPNEI